MNDKNKRALAVGDTVLIRAVVLGLVENAPLENIGEDTLEGGLAIDRRDLVDVRTIETDHIGVGTDLRLEASQLEKVDEEAAEGRDAAGRPLADPFAGSGIVNAAPSSAPAATFSGVGTVINPPAAPDREASRAASVAAAMGSRTD